MVRYKQTWIGFGWSIIRPLINTLIFGTLSIFVTKSGNVSERFLAVSGAVVFWQLISTCISDVSNSLSSNANILTKVYFPKILLPLSGLLVCLVDFVIAFALFLIAYLVMKGLPPVEILLLPLVLVYGLVFALGFGLIAATASVKYRDVRFILPFIVQILFYASPVFIESKFVYDLGLPQWAESLYQLNPLVGILNAYKFCLYGVYDHFSLLYFLVGMGITAVMLVIALRYFLKFEKSFADYI